MSKIVPFLWFDHQAEEAVQFYTGLFQDARITGIARYGEGAPRPAGSVMTVAFELEGQEFVALNGGPMFQFSQAISFFVKCNTQDEIDRLWDALSEGGQVQQCGWLIDKYGITWQIVPPVLIELLKGPDAEQVKRVTQAMLPMKKIDIASLERAARGG